MAFPADVKLVRVTCGTGYDFSGDPIAITLEVAPVLGGSLKRLIHAATGTFMTRDALTFKSDPGSPATFTVPSPAQAETWKDGSGEFFTNWSYSVTVTTRTASGKIQSWIQSFQPVDGQETVDLDLVPDGQIGSPTSAPAPAVTSVNGQSGAVVIDVGEAVTPESVAANLTVEAVDAKLPERLSESALSAAIVESVEPGGTAFASIIPASVLKLSPKPPTGFRGLSTLPTPKVRRTMAGKFTAELDLDALRPPAGVTYYTGPTASTYLNGINDGLTPDKPLTLLAILAKPDVGTIRYNAGEYDRGVASLSSPFTKSLNHIAEGDVKITGWNKTTDLAWTSAGGNVYQATRSTTYSVIDVNNLTASGDYTIYTKKTDLASIVEPGQWAIVGSVVYVWPIGNTDLTVSANREQIRLQITVTTGIVPGPGTTQYVEGMSFYGSSVSGGILAGVNSKIIAKNCKVKYAQTDGFATKGGHLISVGCEAALNGADGFNYHDTQNLGGEFIEIDCSSHHNGLSGTAYTNNASTAHEAVTGIRVNGIYDHAGGPVVADVNSAQTWNLGCHAGGPGLPVHIYQNASWRLDSAGYEANPAQMWLDECTSTDSAVAYHVTGPGKIHIHASGWGNDSLIYPGTVLSGYAR